MIDFVSHFLVAFFFLGLGWLVATRFANIRHNSSPIDFLKPGTSELIHGRVWVVTRVQRDESPPGGAQVLTVEFQDEASWNRGHTMDGEGGEAWI